MSLMSLMNAPSMDHVCMFLFFITSSDQTDVLLAQVNVTKSEGAVGVYDDQFMAMEKKLDEVRKIIDGFNQSKVDMAVISLSIDDIK